MEWHSMTADETVKALETDKLKGLSTAKASALLRQYGENKLREKKQTSVFVRFLMQFKDFMVIILLIAALISFITALADDESDFIDPIVILCIVIMNAIVGTVQESRAQKALEALKKLSAPHATVLRDSKKIKINSSEIVRGDILCLSAGDLIPADARIIESSGLKTQESALTGESLPSEKDGNVILPERSSPGDRKNMLLSSTVILSGHATAVVTETGMDTQIGRIAGLLNSEEAPQTPLQLRLAKVSKLLGIGAVAICAGIFVMGVLNKTPIMDSFMLSVSLAVAAIPEGLPAIVTIVLSIGVQRMAKSNAIMRHLPAVETLGASTVICSDKTGTLTQNRMTVTELRLPDGKVSFGSDSAKTILSMGALCCNSTFGGTKSKKSVSGEPTENAIIMAADSAGIAVDTLRADSPRVHELPFSSERKLMTTVHKSPLGFRQITKGAPDVLMSLCEKVLVHGTVIPLSQMRKTELLSVNERMASEALRVIAVAYKDIAHPDNEAESGLIFVGLIGMTDPPRKEVKAAVKTCLEAGITPVMITGDHVVTANAIARQIGIADKKSTSITGAELDRMSDEQLRSEAEKCRVFARVTPEHKVRIVKAFRARGNIVAMTGDGVNDAPALKAADIGCAMGRSGTDVAKSAADMVLTDDNFATIVKAVAEGRGIYDNIKKAVHFLLSCNIGEILAIFVASLFHMPVPLLPIQLLWVNLVTDSLPAMALGVENKEKNIMQRPPSKPDKSFFADGIGFDIGVEGMLVGALTLLAFVLGNYFFDASLALGRTMAFMTLSLCEIIHATSMRSSRSVFEIGIFSNKKMVWAVTICTLLQVLTVLLPTLSSIFKTVPMSLYEWLTVIGLSFVPFLIIEIEKLFKKYKTKKAILR